MVVAGQKNYLINENPSVVQKLVKRVKKEFLGEVTGHDWWHIERVWMMSRYIAQKEASPNQPINMFIIEAASLLHDIADWKFNKGDDSIGPKKAAEILLSLGIDQLTIEKIKKIIAEVSFKGEGVINKPKNIEGKIVQDADRLDALGAIGIARVFAYGGHIGRPIHDPRLKVRHYQTFAQYKNKKSTCINHFYEKLLLLKERLNTKTAKKIARSRHQFMEKFLKQFYKEWERRDFR